MKRVFTKSDFRKFCPICGRYGHEEEFCAASPVTFMWNYGGKEVFLSGSFTQWQVRHKMHKEHENEPFTVQLSLAPGVYQYKFVVDGEWQYDPYEKLGEDAMGGTTNQVEVKPNNFDEDEEEDDEDYFIIIPNLKNPDSQYKIIIVNYPVSASWVAIKGSWDNWKEQIALKKVRTGQDHKFYVALKIAPGSYQFKFIVDGVWTISKTYPVVKKGEFENNVLVVSSYSTLNTPKPFNLEKKAYLYWQREEGKWAHGGSIHHTLQGHSMNALGDKVYIFGGLANGKFTNAMYVYDPRTTEFNVIEDQMGDIPDPRAFHHTMVFGTKILLYGGFNETYLTDYYIFDTMTDIWTQSEIEGDTPSQRERCTLVPLMHDKLVMFGGYYCSPDMEVETYYNDIHVLSLSQSEWIKPEMEHKEGQEIPLPRYGHSANVVKKRMYIFGGITKQHKNLNDMWVLEASSEETFNWKKLEMKGKVPEPRHGHSAITINTNIIYFGGRGNGSKQFFGDLSIFDTLNHIWIHPLTEGTEPSPRYYHGSLALHEGSELLLFGGIRPKEFWHYPRMYILRTKSEILNEEESKIDG